MNCELLSPHFTLSEFERSQTARLHHIDNSLRTPADTEIIANLRSLCEEVLEPLRAHLQAHPELQGDMHGQVIITSGYRCPQLNRLVGGAPNSQHLKGEAADLRIPDLATAREWIAYLLDHTHFDQLILEHDAHGTHWLHVSYRRHGHNRQTFIPNLKKG